MKISENALETLGELIFGHVIHNRLIPVKTYALDSSDMGTIATSEPLTIKVPIPLPEPFCTKHECWTSSCGCPDGCGEIQKDGTRILCPIQK